MAIRLAIGLSSMRRMERNGDDRTTRGKEIHAEIGVPLNRSVAVGGHFGLTFGHEITALYNDDSYGTYPEEYGTLEAGASVQLFASEHLWIAPWLGVISVGEKRLAGGVGAGVDMFRSSTGHSLGLYVRGSQTESFGRPGERSVRGLQLGLAYGFR